MTNDTPHTPAVSVIIPIYGVEDYLPACLDSVLENTLEDIEVIGVDDCSPDRCPQILDEYAARDSRVRAVHLEKNGGQGIARNEGFARATGEYVYFLDSDDMITPNALELVYNRAKADDLDGVMFEAKALFESPELEKRHNTVPMRYHGTYSEGVYVGADLFNEFERQMEWTCYVQRQLWRRQFLLDEGIEFPAAYRHEDEYFAFAAVVSAKRIALMKEPLFLRRYRDGSVMTSPIDALGFASYLDCFWRIARFMREHNLNFDLARPNLGRLRTYIDRHYEVLHDTCDLAASIRGESGKAAYDYYLAEREADENPYLLSPSVVEQCRDAKRLYLYGAGVLARKARDFLHRCDIPVYGSFVTDAGKNNRSFFGSPVIQFDPSAPADEDAVILITLTEAYRDEVVPMLDAAGWRHVYCKDGR